MVSETPGPSGKTFRATSWPVASVARYTVAMAPCPRDSEITYSPILKPLPGYLGVVVSNTGMSVPFFDWLVASVIEKCSNRRA